MNYKLREYRRKKKLTISEMAKLLDISVPFYSQIETGQRRLSYDVAIQIAKIFKMKPDDIFYEDYQKRLLEKEKVSAK